MDDEYLYNSYYWYADYTKYDKSSSGFFEEGYAGKTAAAIPGVGNAINGVTEVALGTAVLIRNGLGVMGILILIILGLPPVVKLGMNTLLYKFLAAIVQPVSDNRMVGCLSTVGDGCRLLLRVLLMVELLLLITIAILSVSFITY